MSQDERILRLENAMATLAELAAKQQLLSEDQQRQAAEQQRLMAEQQRQIGDQQRRTARLEESFVMLTEMLGRHEDSFDELRAAQAETEQKIAALVDAQVRNEEAHDRGMEEVRAALAELADAMQRLAQSQAYTDRRLDGLIDVVRDLRDGRGGDGS